METLTTLGVALALAGVQILPRFLRPFIGRRHRRVLSAGGGFSVAFVFLELLPQVVARSEAVSREAADVLPFVEHEAFFIALVGLTAFYALERMAKRSRNRQLDESTSDPAGLVSIAAFTTYTGIIGYLLWAQAAEGTGDLIRFGVAVGVHLLVVDVGLTAHHRDAYHRVGRWALAGAVVLGWGVGALVRVPASAVGMLLAGVAGGIMLITLKEELPSEEEGRVPAFVVGAAVFVLLVAGW